MSRRTVLELYKKLNKIAKEVFDQDVRALNEAKNKIRLEFRKNKDLQGDAINEKIKVNKPFLHRLIEREIFVGTYLFGSVSKICFW